MNLARESRQVRWLAQKAYRAQLDGSSSPRDWTVFQGGHTARLNLTSTAHYIEYLRDGNTFVYHHPEFPVPLYLRSPEDLDYAQTILKEFNNA